MTIFFKSAGAFCIWLFFLFIPFLGFAQIGINTSEPTTALDVNGAFSIRQSPGIHFMDNSSTDFFDPYPDPEDIPYSLYVVGYQDLGWQDFDISGVKPVSGSDGQFLVIVNYSPKKMTLKHNNSSIPENGFWIQGEKDLNLTGSYSNAFLLYSKNLERWVVINKNNHIEVWESEPWTLNGTSVDNGITICSVAIPEATTESSASVNFQGNIPEPQANQLSIEYVEARNNEVVFRIKNTGNELTGIKFNVVINKI